jgi:hypothetical protein
VSVPSYVEGIDCVVRVEKSTVAQLFYRYQIFVKSGSSILCLKNSEVALLTIDS